MPKMPKIAKTPQTPKDLLIAWLNDAHSMEHSLGKVLDNHIKDAADNPEIRAKLEEHRQLAESQANRIRGCIERMGGSVSALKTGMATVMGVVQGMSTGIAAMGDHHDELVKNALADYSAEHFEIACYRALVAAAEAIQEHETARVCREIMAEEEEMAAWLEQRLPSIVNEAMAAHGGQTKAA